MPIKKGSIVRSTAGHDQYRYYVVVDFSDGYAFIVDGKLHRLEKPKKKNPIHLAGTSQQIALEEITSDRWLRKRLAPLNEALRSTMQQEGGY